MLNDYRNTEFCPKLENIEDKKQTVVNMVKHDYPRARDMHAYVSKNKAPYKRAFIKAYNGKCSYCGVSLSIIPIDSFEIDHFINEKDPRFRTKADAGYIENLVLACHRCNHAKSSIIMPNEVHEYLHPDKSGIKKTFFRDDDFYIKISAERSGNQYIKCFYDKLGLGSEVHRLDFLLMDMIGLQTKILDANNLMGEAIRRLQRKRNLMSE